MRNAVAALLIVPLALSAQAPQTQADDYTRYELLVPGSAKFRILYEVTATTAGATHYFNGIRKGSIATDEFVYDRATGKPLPWDVVGLTEARAGGVRGTDTSQKYIRVTLARPVPADGGEARVLIDKTYEDLASYFTRGDTIVFTRPLGIKRNSVILPKGYELISSSFPSQVLQEPDGRIGISFWNNTPSEAAVTVRARPAAVSATTSAVTSRLGERARQSREIVYFLQQPETNAFDLYHDYTETRAGTAVYLNIVRAGSTVSNPRAKNLDTGEDLKWDIRGDTVFFRFAPVKAGETTRIRMFETYTDTARYKLVNDELIWDRAFGRPFNAVVLPAGWMLTNSAIPATVTTTSDGRTRLDFVNARPDEIAVLITARRRRVPTTPSSAQSSSLQYRSPAGVDYLAQADTGPIARAAAALGADPRNIDRIIALGVAQSGARQFREAIATFARGLEIAPDHPMLLRWRGHRYLSLREFDKAYEDLARGYRIDSTNYGILYHLGIVNFVRGDFRRASELFAKAQPRAPDAGELAGSTDWLWMALMRAGRANEARAMLARRPDSLNVSNAYTRRLQLYRGEIGPDVVITPADTADVQAATLSFGIGNWYLVRGDTANARLWFDRAVKTGGWPGFGFILSEVELRRLR
ncbi:MAG: tetratricopeptide repeat protein [Gemmatimonadaceae bacterium]